MHQTLLLWKSRSPKGICKRKRERGWWEAFLPLLFCRPPSSWKRPKCRWLFPSSFRTYVAKLLSGSKLVTLISFQHARWWTDKSWRRCEAFSCLENHQKVIRNTRCHLLLPSPQKFLFLDAEEEAGFLLCTGAANQLLMWPLFLFFCYCSKVSGRAISHRLHLIFAAASVENILRKFHTLPTLKKAFASSF